MRISTLIVGMQILTASLLMASNGRAQSLTFEVKQVPVIELLKLIERQIPVTFAFNDKTLQNLPAISLKVSDQPLDRVLSAIEKQVPLQFHQNGNLIGVVRKEHKVPIAPHEKMDRSNPPPVSGKVTDEKGQPLPGVTIRIKNTTRVTTANENGAFVINNVPDSAVLVFSFIGYITKEVSVPPDGRSLVVALGPDITSLKEVTVSTGYQDIPQERATGSFVFLNNNIITRSTSTNILDRLPGITSGLILNNSSINSGVITTVNNNKTGIRIRGVSTLAPSLVGGDPLVVVDNFPYQGDFRNINPNDVESITLLKDAAAASIWGARSGNGVIVITTKKGNINQAIKVEYNASISVSSKPNLSYDKNFLNSSSYIDAETYLFNQGYFNSDISNTSSWPVISPIVEILAKKRAGTISSVSATTQIEGFRNIDVRDDFSKFIYQKAVKQQYSLGIRGGSQQSAYALSMGYDNNGDNLVRNGQERITLNSFTTYTPVKQLEIAAGINYSQTKVLMNNQVAYGQITQGGKYGLYPYARFADANGNALSITKDYRSSYVDSIQRLGFLDQHYRPLNELDNANNTARINDLVLKVSATYHFTDFLNIQTLFQNEHQVTTTNNYQSQQTYYVSNLINQFTQYNTSSKSFTYPFPLGGILDLGNYTLNSNNFRLQANYNKIFNKKHAINAVLGSEISEIVNTGYLRSSYGYSDQFGTAVTNLNYNTSYTTNPSGSNTISSPTGSVNKLTYRYLSYFGNAGYTYNNRYTVTLSGRKDGANIFGAKTNDRITPLWSAGLGWNVSNENFYHFDWLSSLRLRMSYGFNGNVYNGSAYSTGTYLTSTLTGAAYINNLTPPNPSLRWEKVQNINLGIDFSSKNNIIQGTIEPYQKNGLDLIETVPLAASTGFTSYNGNAASIKTNGIDITLKSKNLDQSLKWVTTLLFSHLKDRVTKYDVTQTSTSIQTVSGTAILGGSIYSLYSYKWGGLDPVNGDPQGYLNGKISKNYSGIINNFEPDSLIYNGSARPTSYGSLRNDFSYHGFSLSVNIMFELGYYFRRPSINLNYQNILTTPNSDYDLRWQKTGDEMITNVPSLVYPSSSARNTFYQYSEVLVQKADNIRLQDIRLSFDVTKGVWRNMPFSSLQVYSYASNIGIIWRANKYGLDPDAIPVSFGSHVLPNPFTVAFGFKATY